MEWPSGTLPEMPKGDTYISASSWIGSTISVHQSSQSQETLPGWFVLYNAQYITNHGFSWFCNKGDSLKEGVHACSCDFTINDYIVYSVDTGWCSTIG